MIVCLCNAVSDTQIKAAVENGANSFKQARKELKIASQCGKCGVLAREIFNDALTQQREEEHLFYAVGQTA